MPEFNPTRLALARKRRGLNKTKLASLANLSPKSVRNYEAGAAVPSPETVDTLAQVLGFPRAFFFLLTDPPEIPKEGPSFRSLSTMTAGQRDSVFAAGALALELNKLLEARFDLPTADLPDLHDVDDIEAAAQALRTEWGLGERPVVNMVHLLEARGVRVFSLSEDCKEVDAFSLWDGRTPFVFLNTMKSGERGRFDAAHELGHLVLHRHGRPHGRTVEQEANRFASAFLMPRASVVAQAPRLPSLNRLVSLKQRWKVSASALARRLSDLGLMTEWQYRSTCIEIAKRGWRVAEPNGIDRETSQLLKKVLASLKADGVTHEWLARELSVAPGELSCLMFGQLVYGVDGTSEAAEARPRSRAHLRLVE